MKKNNDGKLTFLDNRDIPNEYEIIKLADTCKDIFEIKCIDLSEELEQKMPLLRKIYPPKKKTLKRR